MDLIGKFAVVVAGCWIHFGLVRSCDSTKVILSKYRSVIHWDEASPFENLVNGPSGECKLTEWRIGLKVNNPWMLVACNSEAVDVWSNHQ